MACQQPLKTLMRQQRVKVHKELILDLQAMTTTTTQKVFTCPTSRIIHKQGLLEANTPPKAYHLVEITLSWRWKPNKMMTRVITWATVPFEELAPNQITGRTQITNPVPWATTLHLSARVKPQLQVLIILALFRLETNKINNITTNIRLHTAMLLTILVRLESVKRVTPCYQVYRLVPIWIQAPLDKTITDMVQLEVVFLESSQEVVQVPSRQCLGSPEFQTIWTLMFTNREVATSHTWTNRPSKTQSASQRLMPR